MPSFFKGKGSGGSGSASGGGGKFLQSGGGGAGGGGIGGSGGLPPDIKLGELLVKAGIITQRELDDCIRLAGSKRLHLGQMLMVSGYLTARQLDAAMDAQIMIRDKIIEEDFAVRCLKYACKTESRFKEVVAEQQSLQDHQESQIQWTLGHLLFESEVVFQDQIDAAYQRSNATGIPMGRILVVNNHIADNLLGKALDLLVRIRDEGIEREEAIEALRAAAGISPGSPVTQNLLLPPRRKKVRLGELMLLASIMSEADVLSAVELGLTYGVPIGQVMVEQGYVAGHIVEAALELQEYCEISQVEVDRASEVLRQIHQYGGSVYSILGDLQEVDVEEDKPKLNFEKLLVLARLVSVEQVQQAFDICRQTPEALAKILCLTGFMEGDVHDATLRCYELLDSGRLSQDDALVALDYCFNQNATGRKSFDEALAELGWNENVAMAEAAALAQEQAFDPDRTMDHMQAVADAPPSLNLLEHFGLSSDETDMSSIGEDTQEDEDDGGWRMPEESGVGRSLADLGVATSDAPVINFTDMVMEGAARTLEGPRPQETAGRLAGILDKLSDEQVDPEMATPVAVGAGDAEAAASAGGGTAGKAAAGVGAAGGGAGSASGGNGSSNNDLKNMFAKDAEDAKPAQPKAVEPPKRPDRAALRAQEMTQAPRGLMIDESQKLGVSPEEPEEHIEKKAAVGAAMYRLAESYFEQQDFAEAQKIYEKILAIRQAELGPQHVELVDDLNKLAEVLWVQGHFRQAEPFVARAVKILESSVPVDSSKLAEGMRILAGLYFQQGKAEPSLPLLEHALLLKQTALGENHPDVGNLLREYAKVLKKMGRKEDAEKFYLKAKKILGGGGPGKTA